MLTQLAVRNVVLIEALDLDFGRGLGVLTGETGAGKSILLDALGLVLGNRAETSLVRSGAKQASVTANFEFASFPPALSEALEEAGIEIEVSEDPLASAKRTWRRITPPPAQRRPSPKKVPAPPLMALLPWK